MCVLTFLPSGEDGFILTSNRDEATVRLAAFPPKKYLEKGVPIFYPKDPQGGGTWIGGCGSFTLCLLNGAFQKHEPAPPYRQSRGRVILDFYAFLNVKKFIEEYQFEGIEPFTLVILDKCNKLIVNEIRWDGERVHYANFPADIPKIWSSSTLYPDEVIAERAAWFTDFLERNKNIDSDEILKFHHFGGKKDVENAIKMNRNDVLKTVSITQFQVDETQFKIQYEDLKIQKSYSFRIFGEC